jgi:hypothetical protein
MTHQISVYEVEPKLEPEPKSETELVQEQVHIPRLKRIISLTIEIPSEIIQSLVTRI